MLNKIVTSSLATKDVGLRQNIAAPAISELSGGGYIVAWAAADASGTGIYAQRYTIDGSLWGSEFPVNTTVAGNQSNPSVMADPFGGFYVIWDSPDVSGTGIYGKAYDFLWTEGKSVAQRSLSPGSVSAGNQFAPGSWLFPDGSIGVAWSSEALTTAKSKPPGGTLYGYLYNYDLTYDTYSNSTETDDHIIIDGTEVGIFPNLSSVATLIDQSAPLKQGRTIIGGTAELRDTATGELLDSYAGVKFTSGRGADIEIDDGLLNLETGEIIYTTPTVDKSVVAGGAELVALPDGDFLAFWYENSTIYYQKFNSDGSADASTSTKVALRNPNDNSLIGGDMPAAALLGDGTTLALAWNEVVAGKTTGVNAMWLAIDGTPLSGVIEVGKEYAASLQAPTVAAQGDTGFVVLSQARDAGGNATQLVLSVVEMSDIFAALMPVTWTSSSVADNRSQRITGGDAADVIDAGGGNDFLNGGAGADTLKGGTGDDTYLVGEGDIVTEAGGTGFDEVWSTLGTFVLPDDVEALYFYQDATQSEFTSVAVATGNNGSNIIVTGAGNDEIDGRGGFNLIDGGAGEEDTLVITPADAEDWVTFMIIDLPGDKYTRNGLGTEDLVTAATKSGRVDHAVNVEKTKVGNGTASKVGEGDSKAATRKVSGDRYESGDKDADALKGKAKNEILDGFEGNDTLSGEGGNDALFGRSGDDSLSGGVGNDTLDGGEGADTLDGGAGNDTYLMDVDTTDTVVDAGGVDTISTRLGSLSLTVVAGGGTIENLEHLGDNAFSGTGNNLANKITGGGGNDTLDGGAGADVLVGGSGNDTYVVDKAASVSYDGDGNAIAVPGDQVKEDIDAGIDTVRTTLSIYSLAGVKNVENLVYIGQGKFVGTGNERDNQMTGGALDDRLTGGLGNDTLVATAGNDTFTPDGGTDVFDLSPLGMQFDKKNKDGGFVVSKTDTSTVRITIGSQILSIKGAWGATTGDRGFEIFKFTDRSDVSLDELLVNVTSFGPDRYEDKLGNNDQVQSGLGKDTLIGGAGKDNLDGEGDNDLLDGGTGDDTLSGGLGDDTLDGGAGADSLTGGKGNDIYWVDATGDVVTENAGEGTDTLLTSLAAPGVMATNVENLTYDPAVVGIPDQPASGLTMKLSGSVTSGAKGDKLLVTVAGVLVGGAVLGEGGSYSLDLVGQANGAKLNFALVQNHHLYTVVDGGGLALSANYAGVADATKATPVSVSGAMGGLAESFMATGNDLPNTINGSSGNDSLDGGAGADKLYGVDGNDTLIGGAGVDRLYGGKGDDLYVVENGAINSSDADGNLIVIPGDLVVEGIDEGADAVKVDARLKSWTLAVNVENLEFDNKSDNLTGIGNASNNRITGNDANDRLDGMAGDDYLAGGLGNDSLSGGAGNDTLTGGAGADRLVSGSAVDADQFVFDAKPESAVFDTIADFAKGDKLVLDRSVFSGATWNGNQLVEGEFALVANAKETDFSQVAEGRHLIYNSKRGELYYDADGTGTGEAPILVAKLTNLFADLTYQDFMAG